MSTIETNFKIRNYDVFPSIITEIECENYQDVKNDLINWIYNYKNLNSDGLNISNRGGWHSEYDFFNCKTFEVFLKYICHHVENSLIYSCDLKLDSMWININQKGDYNKGHVHPGATLSGVFWVKTSDNCGNLVLHSNNTYCEHQLLNSISKELSKEYNYYSNFTFTPKEGSIILFPSHILHDVEVNKSESDRISIAFNLSFVQFSPENENV